MFFFNKHSREKLIAKVSKRVREECENLYSIEIEKVKEWAFHVKDADIILLQTKIKEYEKIIQELRNTLYTDEGLHAEVEAQYKILLHRNKQIEKIAEQMYSMVGQNDALANKTKKLLKEVF